MMRMVKDDNRKMWSLCFWVISDSVSLAILKCKYYVSTALTGCKILLVWRLLVTKLKPITT